MKDYIGYVYVNEIGELIHPDYISTNSQVSAETWVYGRFVSMIPVTAVRAFCCAMAYP